MTAVMRPAEARLKASIMTSSSMRWSLTGPEVDCTIKVSQPRTDSLAVTQTSPSEKRPTSTSPSLVPSAEAMASARGRLELPEKIMNGCRL